MSSPSGRNEALISTVTASSGLGRAGNQPAPRDAVAVIVLTPGELRRLVAEEAESAARRVIEDCCPREWLSRDAVAKMLGYKSSYVSELVRRRGLPCHKVGRRLRFRRVEVEAWARGNEA